MSIIKEDLRKIFLFSEINDCEQEILYTFASLKKYNKGEIIFFDTEPSNAFFGILEGSVKIYKISKEGREHIIHIQKKGDTFAEVPFFENPFAAEMRTYPANCMALDDYTLLLKIPYRPFIDLLRNNTSIGFKMLASFAKRLRFLNKHIESISLDDIILRLIKYLLENQESSNNKNIVELKLSKYDLASFLGTIPETLSRVLKKLQNEKLISVDGKTIVLNDIAKLEKMLL